MTGFFVGVFVVRSGWSVDGEKLGALFHWLGVERFHNKSRPHFVQHGAGLLEIVLLSLLGVGKS